MPPGSCLALGGLLLGGAVGLFGSEVCVVLFLQAKSTVVEIIASGY